MATDQQRQPIRSLIDSCVRGLCMDCGKEIAGKLGVRLVIYGGVAGIEVFVCTDKDMHALGRVPLNVLPMVRLDDADSSTATRK